MPTLHNSTHSSLRSRGGAKIFRGRLGAIVLSAAAIAVCGTIAAANYAAADDAPAMQPADQPQGQPQGPNNSIILHVKLFGIPGANGGNGGANGGGAGVSANGRGDHAEAKAPATSPAIAPGASATPPKKVHIAGRFSGEGDQSSLEGSGPGPSQQVLAADDANAGVAAKVSPQAQQLLTDIAAAYRSINSLQMSGVYWAHFDADGQVSSHSTTFVAFYQAPGIFRHEMKNDVLAGCASNKAYVYQSKENIYFEQDINHAPAAPAGQDLMKATSGPAPSTAPADSGTVAPATASPARLTLEKLPSQVSDIIKQQNPSLELALAADPLKELLEGADEISRLPDAPLPAMPADAMQNPTTQNATQNATPQNAPDAKTYPVLLIKSKKESCRLFIDPQSHLLRCAEWDVSAALRDRGAEDVQSALLCADYAFCSASFSGGASAPRPVRWGEGGAAMPASADFSPPASARQAQADLDVAATGGDVSSALVSKSAPDLQLTGLDGKPFHLAEQKGSVIVLDFFATWCGPCVGELPSLDHLYQQEKAAGVKMFLIDQAEDPAVVRKFVAAKQLTPPVIIDDQEQSQRYGVSGIPETVVIGKDGIIRNVFIGAGPDSAEKLQAAVEAASK